MEVDLPVHESSCDEELLDGVDALEFDDESVIDDIEHLEESFAGDASFLHAAEERVAAEVVHTVHIELGGDELMEEMAGVLVAEDGNGEIKTGLLVFRSAGLLQVAIDLLHHEEGDLFVGDAIDEGMFEYV